VQTKGIKPFNSDAGKSYLPNTFWICSSFTAAQVTTQIGTPPLPIRILQAGEIVGVTQTTGAIPAGGSNMSI